VISEKTLTVEREFSFAAKCRDYVQLTKLRLSSLVVFSAAMGFVIATKGDFGWGQMWLLLLGGFLVTGSSNAFNQIIEKDLDKLMVRTANRPLPAGRMSVMEAMIASTIMGVAGILILWIYMNPLCGMLSALSLILYTLAYTPLKRITPFSVFIGAIPGAFPPMLGWIAARNEFGLEAVLLYAIQFLWQFPHFWAIAWVLEDDYKRAGFKMLPSPGGRDKSTAFQTLVYTSCLIPFSFMPYFFHLSGLITAIVMLACGIFFTYQSMQLYKTLEIKAARKLMFGSFIYLPAVQIVLMLDKLF
jgi:protoheme IX farnesyltransferase